MGKMLEEDMSRNARNGGNDPRTRLHIAGLDEIQGGLDQRLADPLPSQDAAILRVRDINGKSDNLHGNRLGKVILSKIYHPLDFA